MWHAHDGIGSWMLFGGFAWIVVLIAFIWLLLSLFSPGAQARRSEDNRPADQDARAIARARYARGEIGRDEFQQIIQDLDAHD